MPRDVRALVLRTADGLSLAADAWLTQEPADAAVVLVHGLGGHRHSPPVWPPSLCAVGDITLVPFYRRLSTLRADPHLGLGES